jgi:hypothetical protein
VSNKDLSRIKNPADNIMLGVSDDKKISIQAKGSYMKICSQNGRIYKQNSYMKEFAKIGERYL